MTTRELLRACARWFEDRDTYCYSPEYAAALRAIADRFDAEMHRADGLAEGGWLREGLAAKELLARLDAPVTK